MPRDVNSTFVEEKNKKENEPIYLYSILDYDNAGKNLYYAEYDQDIVFDGITYKAFSITHQAVGENSSGHIDVVKIMLANVSRAIQWHLENYDFRGKKVVIKIVWANKLDDPAACMEDTFYIDSYTADQDNAEFILSSRFDVVDVVLPLRRYSRNYCAWKFKSSECGYSGSETECNKTFQRCRALNNQKRFGGFPSIPSRKIYTS